MQLKLSEITSSILTIVLCLFVLHHVVSMQISHESSHVARMRCYLLSVEVWSAQASGCSAKRPLGIHGTPRPTLQIHLLKLSYGRMVWSVASGSKTGFMHMHDDHIAAFLAMTKIQDARNTGCQFLSIRPIQACKVLAGPALCFIKTAK